MPQDLTAKKRSFMIRLMQAETALKNARDTMVALRSEWTAENYGTIIVQADIQDPQILHLTPAILASAMVSHDNLETTLAAGNLTNIDAVIG